MELAEEVEDQETRMRHALALSLSEIEQKLTERDHVNQRIARLSIDIDIMRNALGEEPLFIGIPRRKARKQK